MKNDSETMENQEPKTKTIKVGVEQHKKVKIAAAKRGKKVQEVINELIDKNLTD